jgi:hypothetical protein
MNYKQLKDKISKLCEFLGIGYHETPKTGIYANHYHMRIEEKPLISVQYNGDDFEYEWSNYIIQMRANILNRINTLEHNIKNLEELRAEILKWDREFKN